MYRKQDIFEQLKKMNAPRDGIVLMHTALRAVGAVEGGGQGLLDALIEFFKRARFKPREQDHHTLAHAAVEICLCHGGKIAFKKYAPVLHTDVCKSQSAQFIADQSFQTEQTRHTKSHLFHNSLRFSFITYLEYYTA